MDLLEDLTDQWHWNKLEATHYVRGHIWSLLLAKNKLKSSSTHAGRTVGGGKASYFCFLRVKTDRQRRFLWSRGFAATLQSIKLYSQPAGSPELYRSANAQHSLPELTRTFSSLNVITLNSRKRTQRIIKVTLPRQCTWKRLCRIKMLCSEKWLAGFSSSSRSNKYFRVSGALY